jgi:hypothetical protein
MRRHDIQERLLMQRARRAHTPPGAPSDIPPLPPDREPPDIIILPPRSPPERPDIIEPPGSPPDPRPDPPPEPERLEGSAPGT